MLPELMCVWHEWHLQQSAGRTAYMLGKGIIQSQKVHQSLDTAQKANYYEAVNMSELAMLLSSIASF